MSDPTIADLAASDTRTNPRLAVEALASAMDALDVGDLDAARHFISAVALSLSGDVYLHARFHLACEYGIPLVRQ